MAASEVCGVGTGYVGQDVSEPLVPVYWRHGFPDLTPVMMASSYIDLTKSLQGVVSQTFRVTRSLKGCVLQH
jgi:hypothetical protein